MRDAYCLYFIFSIRIDRVYRTNIASPIFFEICPTFAERQMIGAAEILIMICTVILPETDLADKIHSSLIECPVTAARTFKKFLFGSCNRGDGRVMHSEFL